MARSTFTPEELQELYDLAQQWGKIVSRRMFGEAGPGLDVDFDAMEQIAQAAAQGLTEGTLQTLLEGQAMALGDTQPCPECGFLCPVHRQERPLQAHGVEFHQNEPVASCPICRRDFFPSTSDSATRRTRL